MLIVISIIIIACNISFTAKGIVRWEISGFRASGIHVQVMDSGDPLWDKISITSDENGADIGFDPNANIGGLIKSTGPSKVDGYYKVKIYEQPFSGDPYLRVFTYKNNKAYVLSDEYNSPRNGEEKTINMVALKPDEIERLKGLKIIEGKIRLVHGAIEPVVQCVKADGTVYQIKGGLKGEIATRQSLKLKIWGTFENEYSFTAVEYSIKDEIIYLKGWLVAKDAVWHASSDQPTYFDANIFFTDNKEEIQILNISDKMKKTITQTNNRSPKMIISGKEVYTNNKIIMDKVDSWGLIE